MRGSAVFRCIFKALAPLHKTAGTFRGILSPEGTMSRIPYWFSVVPTHRMVFHDNTDCPVAEATEVASRSPGMGRRPYCPECFRLNMAEDNASAQRNGR